MNTEGIDVAFYWSAQEAATILDYLDRLRDLIWEYYAEDIKELRYREVLAQATENAPEDQQAFSFDENNETDF